MKFHLLCTNYAGLILSYSCVLVLLLRTMEGHSINLPGNETFLAIQAFGDSVLDTGNNNNLKTISKCNFPPYGRDFNSDGKATGRFCNGKIISDFIAEAVGIKDVLPSFHDTNLQSKDLQTGLCFASVGSGYDPLTSKILGVYSQSQQLQFFKEYIVKLEKDVGEEKSRTILGKSLYLVSSGNNDILFSYFATHLRKFKYDVASYTDFLVELACRFLRNLHVLGVAVFSVAPLGCLPFARTIGGGTHRACAEKINETVKVFNAKLVSELASLNSQLPDSYFAYVDIYNPLLELIEEPNKFGFEIAGLGCCNTGLVETGVLCNKLEPFTCTNASTYLFWDSIHPTEGAYKIISSQILKQLF
ncbi:Lipase [Parasponia andersonii]|uniref:Lipase n=1 Tax=Parasponia andersonii TaxID=3476 RepID=A0A2P5DJI3_PARAD|nr:Lipase [Parasponia andersonii]